MEIEVINFTNLDENRLKEILKWRNDISVRGMSNNKTHISLNDHLSFVEKLKSNHNNIYYFVNFKTENSCGVGGGGGVIHFNNIVENENAIIGLYKNPDSTMDRVGTFLMELIILIAKQMNLKKLLLDVFKNNKRALLLYEKFDFKIYSEDLNSYYMERIL